MTDKPTIRLGDIPEKFDVVLPAAKKDFAKLPFAVGMLYEHVNAGTTYIVSPEPVYTKEADELAEYDVVFLNEQDVLPIDPGIFKPRTTWVYLQLLKLQILQNITTTSWYIAMDADLFIRKPLPFVVGGRPGLFYGRDRERKIATYGRFTEAMLGYPWNEFSLMNDIALYNNDIIRAMVEHVGGHDIFVDRVAEICESGSYPADAQLYYAWVQEQYPGLYDVRTVSNTCKGMYWDYEFSAEQVRKTIELEDASDTLSLHSWGKIVGKRSEYKI